jgi:hypothetical protein
MSDPFSEYVALLDDIEHIPVAASESSRLSREDRAVVTAGILKLVRDRVLPQSDLEAERRETLLPGGVAAVVGRGGTSQRARDNDAIVERIDDLAHVDLRDAAEVERLLYRLHAAIAGHFGEAELTVAAATESERDYLIPFGWLG